MKLTNIANDGRTIYLFSRDDSGKQIILKDNNFYPYYYEPDANGTDVGYDGVKLKKVICSNPSDVPKQRSMNSYSSDVRYPINYIINRIPEIDKTTLKYFFLDIEVLIPEDSDKSIEEIVAKPIYPVTCITIYNSADKSYKSFFINEYQGKTLDSKEAKLLEDVVTYFRKEKPDIWLSWHVSFDYQYLHNKIPSFAKRISPIEKVRVSKEKDIFYPAGISILDYLTMFKKVNMRENSMKLDNIAEKHLGKGKVYKEVDFSKITDDIKYRNREDVELLVKLEEKFRIIEYFDEIRIFSKALWEDLTHNSLVLDSIVLNEAKNRNVVLPNKMGLEERESEELVGAYRRSEEGVFFNLYKADVKSMYPNQLVNFCLDPKNIVDNSENAVTIEGVNFKQDKSAILPYLAIKLMNIKDELKKKLKGTQINSEESKILQMKYDAYKGLVNSLFGVTAFPSFRLYNNKVASSITFLARDLLHYVEDQMIKNGHKVIALDTDALMYQSKDHGIGEGGDKTSLLNHWVQRWALEKYKKSPVDIEFESEGIFTKILITGKCHYYGYIKSDKGTKLEIKGMEVKRASSSRYESYFQKELIEKILNKESESNILSWIKQEKVNIKNIPIEDVAFPSKLTNKEYKNVPIFIRAYSNSKLLRKDFRVHAGETFYYIYVNTVGMDKNGKDINVLAFTESSNDFITKERIDWGEVIRRNIDMKADAIFESIGWKTKNKPMATARLF